MALALGKCTLLVVAASAAIASGSSGQTVAPANTLSGAQAFITADEARFVFPRQATDSYDWDVPIHGDPPTGGGGYMWDVSWENPADRDGIAPCGLWLIQYWKSGGPRAGSLKSLIEWLRLRPMVKSTKDWTGVDRVRKVDYRKVFATVEDGQLVFVVRGADAVREMFPTIPSKVTFRVIVEETPRRWGPGPVREYKTVAVNDRNSQEIPETRRSKCDKLDWPVAR